MPGWVGFKRLAYRAAGRRVRRRIYGTAGRRAVMRIAARRALISRAYTGGALAATALAGYGAYRGIKRIKAARARQVKRLKIGYPMRRIAVKKRQVKLTAHTNRNSRTLYNYDLCTIPKGGTADEREYDVCNIKGFKIDMLTQNNNAGVGYLNLAICINKDNSAAVPTTTEFFRAYGDDRSQDFANALTDVEFIKTPINADKITVLHRWTIKLNGTAADTGKPIDSNFSKYVPFKRQLRFDNAASIPENDHPYMVYWYELQGAAPFSAGIANAWSESTRIITYFSDATR